MKSSGSHDRKQLANIEIPRPPNGCLYAEICDDGIMITITENEASYPETGQIWLTVAEAERLRDWFGPAIDAARTSK